MAVKFDQDSWVWCPDEEDLYLPGKVKATFKRGEVGNVTFSNGEEHVVREEEGYGYATAVAKLPNKKVYYRSGWQTWKACIKNTQMYSRVLRGKKYELS